MLKQLKKQELDFDLSLIPPTFKGVDCITNLGKVTLFINRSGMLVFIRLRDIDEKSFHYG